MTFYDRLLAQAVQRYVDGSGVLHPLDVVELGGSTPINLTVASAGNVQIIAAPTAGSVWRLHRFVCYDIIGSAGGIALLNGSTFMSALSGTAFVDNLEGQLCGTALSVFNSTSASMRVTLTADQINATVQTG
jgi:hypothetical protein